LAKHFDSYVRLNQLSSFGLREACGNSGGDGVSFFNKPIAAVYLFENEFERLIEDFTGIMEGAGPHRQIHNLLLLGFEFDSHMRFLRSIFKDSLLALLKDSKSRYDRINDDSSNHRS
jgi:hypothetical protein